jgi:hypothetical protein
MLKLFEWLDHIVSKQYWSSHQTRDWIWWNCTIISGSKELNNWV